MQAVQATTVSLSALAIVGVVVIVGLLVALLSSRSVLGALGALGGLFVCGLLAVAFLFFFRIARSGPMEQFAVKSVAMPRYTEPARPPLPPMPPQSDHTPHLGEPGPLRAEAEDAGGAATGSTPPSAVAPPASKEAAGLQNGLPAWATAGERRVDGVYRMPIAIGPFPLREDCGVEKPKAFADAVNRYANEFLEEGAGRYVNLPMSYVNQNIYRTEAEEQRETSFGKMVVVHYLLEFNGEVRQHIEQVYHQALVAERLKYAGLGAAGVFGLLSILFGYLKLDTFSRGYYTGRLRLAAAAAILGLVSAVSIVVAYQAP